MEQNVDQKQKVIDLKHVLSHVDDPTLQCKKSWKRANTSSSTLGSKTGDIQSLILQSVL